MQRKQEVGECWVCVILFACVCVGTSDSKTMYDDPSSLIKGLGFWYLRNT
jgi:hypothetical protein